MGLDLDSTNSVYKSYDGDECNKGEISNLKIPGEEKNLGESVKLTKSYRNLENNYFKINKTIQTVIGTTDEDLEMMTSGLADIALDIRKSSPSKGIKNTDYKAIKTKCANIHKKKPEKTKQEKEKFDFLENHRRCDYREWWPGRCTRCPHRQCGQAPERWRVTSRFVSPAFFPRSRYQ